MKVMSQMIHTVTIQQVNRHAWKRQGFDLANVWSENSPEAVQIGVYGFGPSLYPGLLARFGGLQFEQVERAINEERSLVRMGAMRLSLFAIPRSLAGASQNRFHFTLRELLGEPV
jgi:hypothetical protein